MYILEVSFPLSQFVLFLPLALVFEISVVQMGVVSQVQGAWLLVAAHHGEVTIGHFWRYFGDFQTGSEGVNRFFWDVPFVVRAVDTALCSVLAGVYAVHLTMLTFTNLIETVWQHLTWTAQILLGMTAWIVIHVVEAVDRCLFITPRIILALLWIWQILLTLLRFWISFTFTLWFIWSILYSYSHCQLMLI
jgi:hypothetical protein